MCGDLEEQDTESERLYAAFLQAAHVAIHEAIDHRGGSRGRLEEQRRDPACRLSDETLHGYMDGLFGDILTACVKDGRLTGESDRYRVLASQSIVLARLAGFLASQLDLREDPLASVIEALMAGYSPQRPHDHE
ncbi:MAG: hypothetical protein ACREFT_18740 [Acetobacteraceae bacterium]